MSEKIINNILNCPDLKNWPNIKKTLKKHKPGTTELFKIAYASSGNNHIDSLPIQAAIVCFVINCILIDDILDKDEKGIYHQYGTGRVANLATTLQARAQILIEESKFSFEKKSKIITLFNQMKFLESQAQEKATHNKPNLKQYWKIVHGKSGNVCGTVMLMGAELGDINKKEANFLYEIGKNMGEVGQISNDLRGAFQETANPDWVFTGSSLPILLCLTTKHAYLTEFKSLLSDRLPNKKNLKKAQDILVSSGSVTKSCDHIAIRLKEIYKLLNSCSLPNQKILYDTIAGDLKNAIKWLNKLDIKHSKQTNKILCDLNKKIPL